MRPPVWILSRPSSDKKGAKPYRAYTDPTRAQEDLDLVKEAGGKWEIEEVPLFHSGSIADAPAMARRPAAETSAAVQPAASNGADGAKGANGSDQRSGLNPVQHLALYWLFDGATAEEPFEADDPVVVSPTRVRGFLSVPPEDWHELKSRGLVDGGRITEAGRELFHPDGT